MPNTNQTNLFDGCEKEETAIDLSKKEIYKKLKKTKKRIRKMNPTFRERASVLIDLLQQRFPKAFPQKPNPKVPLAIGTLNELFTLKEELGIGIKITHAALQLWCTNESYWRVVSEVGAPRYDIYGNVCGHVTDIEAENALMKIQINNEIINEANIKKEAEK